MTLQEKADLLFNNLNGWEQNTLKRIGARIKRIGEMRIGDLYQFNALAATKQDFDLIIKELATVTGKNVSEIEKIYADTLNEYHIANKPLFDYRGKEFIPLEKNLELQAIIKAYAKETADTFINISSTKALGFTDINGNFVGMRSAIYNALGKAVLSVQTGSTDFNTAMRDTIKALGGSGVKVNYGSGVTRQLSSVVRQNILYGVKQAHSEYNALIGEQLNTDGWEIDWHSNPRPSHVFMQGKQYSKTIGQTVNGVYYPSIYDTSLNADNLSVADALNDYGCLHFETDIILGVSVPRYSEEELNRLNKENSKPITIGDKTKSGYEWKQTMRNIESTSRKLKNENAIAKASGDKELVKKNNEKLAILQAKYNQISEITGIKAQYEKMV